MMTRTPSMIPSPPLWPSCSPLPLAPGPLVSAVLSLLVPPLSLPYLVCLWRSSHCTLGTYTQTATDTSMWIWPEPWMWPCPGQGRHNIHVDIATLFRMEHRFRLSRMTVIHGREAYEGPTRLICLTITHSLPSAWSVEIEGLGDAAQIVRAFLHPVGPLAHTEAMHTWLYADRIMTTWSSSEYGALTVTGTRREHTRQWFYWV